MWSLALTAYELQNGRLLFYGTVDQILGQYAKYKEISTGLFSHLLCDYDERWTAKTMLESHGVALIPGTVKQVQPRTGVVAKYVEKLLQGDDEGITEIGYTGINELL
jgi:hypothetical protein